VACKDCPVPTSLRANRLKCEVLSWLSTCLASDAHAYSRACRRTAAKRSKRQVWTAIHMIGSNIAYKVHDRSHTTSVWCRSSNFPCVWADHTAFASITQGPHSVLGPSQFQHLRTKTARPCGCVAPLAFSCGFAAWHSHNKLLRLLEYNGRKQLQAHCPAHSQSCFYILWTS
jgi:hypothetical protein